MGRKKKESTSTVTIIQGNSDWGKILYNACYIFNKNLADYWLSYNEEYNNGKIKIDDAAYKIKEIDEYRQSLLDNKKKLKNESRIASINITKSYRQYVKSLPIGEMVAKQRKSSSLYEEHPFSKELISNYLKKIDEESNAIQKEKEYNSDHLFETRSLSSKIKLIKKMANIHEKPLAHSILLDKKPLYDFLASEEQIEKLMGVCINILNTYSAKEFITVLNEQDKERVAEYIFNYFNDFEHNFDFIAGCYELKEDGKLHLKSFDVLKNKLYNGYYFTIRGFVQRAYIKARDEHYNVQSSDDKDNKIKGVCLEQYGSSKKESFDEGMVCFWNSCRDYLNLYHKNMALEFHQMINEKFDNLSDYYNEENTKKMILEVINGLNTELGSGRTIGNKFKYIILDSTRGAESKMEWEFCIKIITEIIKKYLNKFFKENMQ